MGDFSAHLLQIPVMLVTLPQPLSNCQAQPFVFLIAPEKAWLGALVGTPGWLHGGEAALLLLWHAAGCRLLREDAQGTEVAPGDQSEVETLWSLSQGLFPKGHGGRWLLGAHSGAERGWCHPAQV